MINFDNIGLVRELKIVTVIVNFWRNFRSLMDAEI